MQMAQNIRRYKGVPPMPVFNGISEITLDGNLGDWQHVRPYADTRGDVIHRDHDGYGNLHYTDSTGRNDIIATRVAVGKRDLYFSAETAASLTPYNDPRWMLLLIDSDQDAATGWHGFDYIVNLKVVSERLTTLQRFNNETRQWELAAEIPYATKGNVLEVSIPRKLLGKGRNHIALDFKWTDNPSSLDDIISLCTSGDTAPNRRFAYRFTWKR